MQQIEKIKTTIEELIRKTEEDIRDGEPYLKDPVLHNFYEGQIPVLRKKKQELLKLLKMTEELEENDGESEEDEEDIIENV